MKLKTDFPVGEIPHSSHPCPQRMRENWLCLNGKWDFFKIAENGKKEYDGKILVPFSPESLLSGVDDGFSLSPNETLVYKRKFVLTDDLLLGKTLLHFGAVDQIADVYINGIVVGKHRGGFTPFTLDISHAVKKGENELVVECKDEGSKNGGARGKQNENRGGIWYTPQSGIWQTVWLESMPEKHIGDFKIIPNATEKTVKIESAANGEEQEIVVYDGENEILRERFQKEITLSYPFELWSPEHPKLYDFTLSTKSGDCVRSYFGVRSFGQAKDKKGKLRLTLNGKPYFMNGVLDQGYFSDGMLTYPSDEAAEFELKTLKDMGFNTVRKHIKLEPMRWYYHCDQLGLIVWQDFVNGGEEYKFSHIALLPFLGVKHRDDDYQYFAREDSNGRREFIQSVDETVNALYNCVCIGLWTVFNEGWGQFDSARFTKEVKEKDPTRIVDSVSGWHDQGYGKTELKSLHTYYTPLKVPRDKRAVVLSEFGGYSMKIDGHVFDESKEFGYKKFKTQKDLVQALKKLYLKKILPLIKKGLSACIYTQVSDVEEEINGFFTYDRKVLKVPVSEMKEINDQIKKEADTIL